MGNRVAVSRVSRRTKIMALGAAGAVLVGGIGITSLAAWTDQEYVQGGVGGTSGIGASAFEVQQHVSGDAGTTFFDRETAPTAGVIDFGTLANALSPGSTVYGWVQVKTRSDSIAGSLTLTSTIASSASDLSTYLTYGARIVSDTTKCAAGAGNYAAGTAVVPDNSAMTTNAPAPFTLAANGSETKTVCFAITMPAGTSTAAMGKTLTPTWYFDAISS